MNYRELNESVMCHIDDEEAVCEDSIWKWRSIEGGKKLIHLKAAYLQIRIAESLWKNQLMRFKGKIFCLIRLDFLDEWRTENHDKDFKSCDETR